MNIVKFLDEESSKIYELRKKYASNNDNQEFLEAIDQLKKEWSINQSACELMEKKVVIYGAGKNGFWTKATLNKFGIFPVLFCDSDKSKQGMELYGIKVISKEELCSKHRDKFVVIASEDYKEEILEELKDKSFPETNIYCPEHGIITASCGNQYFDFFEPLEEEIFVDAGAFDGETTAKFYKWAGKNAKGAYVLEPFKKMEITIANNIAELENVNVVMKAAWSKNEILHLDGEERGTKVTDNGNVIEGVTIDSIVKNNKVTYIKMDIEGSELEALYGAKETILRNKPRLAICVYHKPEDIIEIPEYISQLVPEYKFALRHYTYCTWETVLYAWSN